MDHNYSDVIVSTELVNGLSVDVESTNSTQSPQNKDPVKPDISTPIQNPLSAFDNENFKIEDFPSVTSQATSYFEMSTV